MKTLKVKYLLSALAAFCFAVGVFQYAGATSKPEVLKKDVEPTVIKVLETETWYFTGAIDNDVTNPENYSLDPEDGKPCVTPLETICRIQAPKNPLNEDQPHMAAPIDNSTVEQQITDAANSLSGPSPSPTLNSTVTAFRAG